MNSIIVPPILTETQLDERLAQWAKEYGSHWSCGGGGTTLQMLIDHRGFIPNSGGGGAILNTKADEVEAAVMRMQNTLTEPGTANPYYRAAFVLRAEHLTPNYWPEMERLRWLERIGIAMGRHTYYRMLQFARAFLAGYLARG